MRNGLTRSITTFLSSARKMPPRPVHGSDDRSGQAITPCSKASVLELACERDRRRESVAVTDVVNAV